MRGRPRNTDYRNVVFKCLLDAPSGMWVNQISRLTGIPAKTVTNILDEFHDKELINDNNISKITKAKVKLRFVSLKPIRQEELANRLKAEKIVGKIKSWRST